MLENTGERLLTEVCDRNTLEHLHRYALATTFCRGKDVLDIASGEGYGAHILAGTASTVAGVDISAEAVAHAIRKYQKSNLKFVQGSVVEIPLETNSVDVVVSFETIEHHARHEEMMSEIKRVLRPEGVLVISSPDKLNYTDIPAVINPFHVKELYREEFLALVRSCFANVAALSQRVAYGSVVAPENGAEGFTEYWGSFEEVGAASTVRNPMYNLCIASDAALNPIPASFFDGEKVFEAIIEDVRRQATNAVMESRAFRLGRALTWPARVLFRREAAYE
jgi:SAM-dependent methyltransferase